MKLSKGWIIAIVVVAFFFIMIMSSVSMYNGLVKLEEGVNGQWANVENVYQRRSKCGRDRIYRQKK